MREAERSGRTIGEISRSHGVSQQFFYRWLQKSGGLWVSDFVAADFSVCQGGSLDCRARQFVPHKSWKKFGNSGLGIINSGEFLATQLHIVPNQHNG
jgi:hypothetical protein